MRMSAHLWQFNLVSNLHCMYYAHLFGGIWLRHNAFIPFFVIFCIPEWIDAISFLNGRRNR
ncbi:hypothetical protein QBC43DRAFT_322818 [Cladorrhinum sp. PSN259]|nr:hypothetical protein QBC43DRAFT_322818 [Cladorrhinum sp. PSN259]